MASGMFAGQSALPSYLQPSQGKGLYAGNYLNFAGANSGTKVDQWAQQFLPDVYDKEIEIYGNRTISGFLKMVSAEMPSSSDEIIWLEQGRLHTRYTGIAQQAFVAGTSTTLTVDTPVGPTNNSGTSEGSLTACNFRAGQTVMVGNSNGTCKGIITAVDGLTFTMTPYNTIDLSAAGDLSALVYGSEFAKGTGNFTEKLDPSYTTYSNSPIIMKEHYSINGSDTGQIGWVEVTSENGASGYLWYVKAEHENRLRWEDYLEMSMVEGVKQTGTGAALKSFRGDFGDFDIEGAQGSEALVPGNSGQTARGTEGFFAALEARGNVYDNLSGEIDSTTSTDAGFFGTNSGLGAFDAILKQMDKQGSIEENMLYVNRDLSLAFTDMLAGVNSNGGGIEASYGVFNNSKDMSLDLHFSGFRRGSYDFYQTDWKYLNDYSTRGGFGDIEGVLIPAGTSTVYDQNLGKNIKRPFLHVRYRSSETDNRKMKSWITGSVGGAYTTDVDEMRMHYLTERCLITQGANNFYLFKA